MDINILIVDDKKSYVQSLKELLQGPHIGIDIAITYNDAIGLLVDTKKELTKWN